MSGRIRSVKPEWLEDEILASTSDAARMLSVALILMADDHGRGRAAIATIAAEAWRYEMQADEGASARETLAKASRALRELSDARFVRLYEVDRQRYFEIRNWKKHQRVDRPSKPRVPAPIVEENQALADDSRDPREDSARPSRDPRETLATDLRSPTSDRRSPSEESRAHEDRVEERGAVEPAPLQEHGTEQPGPLAEPWMSPNAWLRSFGAAWSAKRGALYGHSGDGRACGSLDLLLERLGSAQVMQAWERRERMFESFLADDDPRTVKAGHVFAFFVPRFTALALAPAAPPRRKSEWRPLSEVE